MADIIAKRTDGTAQGEGPNDPGKRATLRKLAALGLLALVDVGALSSCGRRSLSGLSAERKVIVLGVDGLSPHLVRQMMSRGQLPNLSRLAERGGYRALGSTVPPQSPVAWSTFATGLDPGQHGITDFICRRPETYLPYLSIAQSEPAERTLSLGQWRLPLSRGKVEMLRRGRAFWEVLTEQGVPCDAYRVPANFPPRECGARQVAGLGAPDLRGTYGEFSYYTDEPFPGAEDISGGNLHLVNVANGAVRAHLLGPSNTLREGEPDSRADFDVYLDRQNRAAKIVVQGLEVVLKQGEWSAWVPVRFELMPHLQSVGGICRFYLKEVAPAFKLYVTPVNIDPMDPALPVTAPAGFARELAEKSGRFYTQGFPDDVKALRHGVLDEGEYLHQSALVMDEVRRMYESALNEFERGMLFYYFATSDRTQHMFWRTLDPRHPAYDEKTAREFRDAIPECYRTADELVGQAMEAMDDSTTLIVLSDHGFAPWYRAFNLNSWLAENGFLSGIGPWGDGGSIFVNADWTRTIAYGLGFNSLYLNLAGREQYGTVLPAEKDMMLDQLSAALLEARDPETGEKVIEGVYRADRVYASVIPDRSPDLIVGYKRGYRCSDASVLGDVAKSLAEDNVDKWSGDHCIDAALVPGVLFASKRISAATPALPDVTASVLAEFGAETPEEMTGEPVW